MKILVPIASRGRPLRLAGVLHSLTVLQSKKHEVSYVVRLDEDDEQSLHLMADLIRTYDCEVVIKPKPITLGQSWNELAQGREWEACAVMADKHLCLTPDWDDCVAQVVGRGLAAARWRFIGNALETAPILSRKWYDALGFVFPEWFPFWFSERWLVEVHTLAFGQGIPIVQDMPLAEPEWKTQGLRDLEFWFNFFAKTRGLRMQDAVKVSLKFGTAYVDQGPLLQQMHEADEWQKPRIPLYYKERGEPPGPPTKEYSAAKARAVLWLEQHERHELMRMEPAGAA